jgi:hypothetical protein
MSLWTKNHKRMNHGEKVYGWIESPECKEEKHVVEEIENWEWRMEKARNMRIEIALEFRKLEDSGPVPNHIWPAWNYRQTKTNQWERKFRRDWYFNRALSDEVLAHPCPFCLTRFRELADLGIVKSPQFRRFPWDADVVLIYISIEGVGSFHVTTSRIARHARHSTAVFEKAPVPRLKFVVFHM